MERAFAVSLKIPDNAAYTALVTLRRLGIDVARVERSEIWRVDDHGEPETFAERMERNEMIFNPNKHRLTVLETIRPRSGEVWIEMHGDEGRLPQRYVGWRLADATGAPVAPAILHAAAERLLANPAIEKAIFAS
jgi:hypothetical protein